MREDFLEEECGTSFECKNEWTLAKWRAGRVGREESGRRSSIHATDQGGGEGMACSRNHKWVRMVGVAHVGENGKRGAWRSEQHWVGNDLVYHGTES